MSSVATLRPHQNGTVRRPSGEWSAIGHWRPGDSAPAFDPAGIAGMAHRVREPICVVTDGNGNVGTAAGGEMRVLEASWPTGTYLWIEDRA